MTHFTYGDIFDPAIWAKVVDAYVTKLPALMQERYSLSTYALGASGFSGALVAMAVGHRLSLPVWIVRKEESHGTTLERRPYGNSPIRPWVFLDDFVDTGATRDRCIAQIGYEPVCDVLYAHTVVIDRDPPNRHSVWD